MEQYRDIKVDGYPDLNTVVEVWIEENEMPFQAGWRNDGLGPCWHSENYEVQENKDNIRYWRPIRLDRPGASPSPAKAERPFNRDENSVEGKAAIEFYEWLQRSSMAKAEVPINIKWRMFVDQKNVKQKNNQ